MLGCTTVTSIKLGEVHTAEMRGRRTEAEKEKGPDESDPFSLMLAERTGLEPATPGVTGRYSNQLN